MQKEQRPALKHPLWLLLTTPIILTALISVGMLVYNGYISLTQFNGLNLPEFIGLKNYGALLSSAEFWSAAGYTALVLILSGGICVGLGWLGGTGAARLPMPLQVAVAVLAGLGTIVVICFEHIGIFTNIELYCSLILPLKLVLKGLWLAFLIFYIGALTGRPRAAWHIAVGAMPVWMLLDKGVPFNWTGNPKELNLWMPNWLDYEENIKFEIGYGGTILISMLLIVGLLTGAAHLAVRLIARRNKTASEPLRSVRLGDKISRAAALVGGAVAFVTLLLLFLIAITPDDDPLALFPLQNISAENFIHFGELQYHPFLYLLPVYMLVSLYIFFVAVLPPAVFFSFSSSKLRRPLMVVMLTASSLLSIFAGSYWVWAWFGMIDAPLPVMILECIAFPIYPVCLLFTTLLLRRVTAGCQNFSEFLRSVRRVGATATCLAGSYLLFALALLFAQGTDVLIYSEHYKFPLSTIKGVSRASMGAGAAASVLLIAVGAVLLIGGVVAIAVGVNKILPKIEQN